MQKITPFLWFDKNCEEAINFYVSVFKENPKASMKRSEVISIKRYPDGPLEPPMQGMEGKVLTAVFELSGQQFMALDGGPVFKPTAATSFYVECKTQEEVDYFWNRLSVNPAFEQCGWLQDAYGFSWQIIPKILPELLNDSDKEKANRVMQAMLKMKKIDIRALKKAAKGK